MLERALIFAVVSGLVALGYAWGHRDGSKRTVRLILSRWLRQCLVCGRDHLSYAANQCDDGKQLRRELKSRWNSVRKD